MFHIDFEWRLLPWTEQNLHHNRTSNTIRNSKAEQTATNQSPSLGEIPWATITVQPNNGPKSISKHFEMHNQTLNLPDFLKT